MGQLALLVRHLANVVEQTSTFCLLGIEPKLGSHNGAEVSRLAGVLQQILSVG